MGPSQQYSSEGNANQEDFHLPCSYQLNHSLPCTSQPSWSGTFAPPLEFDPVHPEAPVIDLSHDDPTALRNHPVQDLRRDGEPDIGEWLSGVSPHGGQVSVCVAIYLMVD